MSLSKRKYESFFNTVSTVCSLICFVAMFLQPTNVDDRSLLFCWFVAFTVVALGVIASFVPSHLLQRSIFVFLFAFLLTEFSTSWGAHHERGSEEIRIRFLPDDKEKRVLEDENWKLKDDARRSILWWQSIAHLVGLSGALLGATASPERSSANG